MPCRAMTSERVAKDRPDGRSPANISVQTVSSIHVTSEQIPVFKSCSLFKDTTDTHVSTTQRKSPARMTISFAGSICRRNASRTSSGVNSAIRRSSSASRANVRDRCRFDTSCPAIAPSLVRDTLRDSSHAVCASANSYAEGPSFRKRSSSSIAAFSTAFMLAGFVIALIPNLASLPVLGIETEEFTPYDNPSF